MSIQRKLPQNPKSMIKRTLPDGRFSNMAYDILVPYFNQNIQNVLQSFLTANPQLANIYNQVIFSYLQGNHKQSLFFAEKLLCLTQDTQVQPHVVYLNGYCHFNAQEYSSVFSLFERFKYVSGDFSILAARSYLANKQYDKAIELLDNETSSQADWIRGQCYEAQENKALAVANYQECLQKSPTNIGAFKQLVDTFLISQQDKENLLSNIHLPAEDGWLKEFYATKTTSIELSALKIQENIQDERRKIATALQVSQNEIIKTSPTRQFQNKQQQQNIDPSDQSLYNNLDRRSNIDILCVKAKRAYYAYDIHQAYELSKKVVDQNKFYFEIIPVYVSCLLELGLLAKLYKCAHDLIENYTNQALSWFVVGAYYFLTKKNEIARKQFQKAISMDQHLIYAWIGLAHSYAIQDESDQAMSIYRSISRQFPGCYQAHVYIGMEYLRTNNLKTALLSLEQARQINPTDPMIYNEIGVIYFKQRQFADALESFLTALAYCQNSNHKIKESSLQNLGHTYRKLKDYKNAIQIFEKCVQLNSTSHQIFFGLGFSYHLSELPHSLSKAIHYYHKSLSLKTDQPFVQDMLGKALTEAADAGLQEFIS
ncbi:hypothetical protein pb186bvf_016718 [Paramecium bursaria]